MVEKDEEIASMKEQLAKNQTEMEELRQLMRDQMRLQQKLLDQNALVRLGQNSSEDPSRAETLGSALSIVLPTSTPEDLVITPEPSFLIPSEKESAALNQRIDNLMETLPAFSLEQS